MEILYYYYTYYTYYYTYYYYYYYYCYRIQSVIKKAKRYGYLSRSFSALDKLTEDSDQELFFSS